MNNGFSERTKDAETFQTELFEAITSMGFQVAKNGTEHTHPNFVENLRRSTDQTSLAIRFQPDGVAAIGRIPRPLTESEKRKCKALAIETGFPCLMLVGVPSMKPYWAMQPNSGETVHEEDGEAWVSHTPDELDYALSNYKDYPRNEHRFFVSLGFDATEPYFREMFSDIESAVAAARQARFEFSR